MTGLSSQMNVFQASLWAGLEVLAVDIDGTLTTAGHISAGVISALQTVRARGMKVCLVTGRPSGWVQGLATYLPVDAAIAENGGVIFLGAESSPLVRNPQSGQYNEFGAHDSRKSLQEMFNDLQTLNSNLHVTQDNVYRLSDFTFHVQSLSVDELLALKHRVEGRGLAFTWSTIHAHIMPAGQEKGTALEWLLDRWGIATHPAKTTLTVGDSPNDATLFCESSFPLTAGVANIIKYRPLMSHYPKIISTQAEGDGFIEIVNTLLSPRSETL